MFYSGDFPYVNLYQRVIDVNSYLGCVYYLISPIYCGTWGMYGIPSSDGHGKLGITMILNVYPCDLPNIDLAVGRCREMEDDIFSWKNGKVGSFQKLATPSFSRMHCFGFATPQSCCQL